MVEFIMLPPGKQFVIKVNGETIGGCEKGKDFFTHPSLITKYIEISSEDLMIIANETKIIKETGHLKRY